MLNMLKKILHSNIKEH